MCGGKWKNGYFCPWWGLPQGLSLGPRPGMGCLPHPSLLSEGFFRMHRPSTQPLLSMSGAIFDFQPQYQINVYFPLPKKIQAQQVGSVLHSLSA